MNTYTLKFSDGSGEEITFDDVMNLIPKSLFRKVFSANILHLSWYIVIYGRSRFYRIGQTRLESDSIEVQT